MTDTNNAIAPKWWGSSLTIRGALLSAASAALPAVAAIVGIDGESIRLLGEQTVVAIQAVGGVVGMALTVAGRVRATVPLTRRSFDVRI